MNRLLILDASVINENQVFTGDILVEGDRIKKIFPAGEGKREELHCSEILNAKGLWLLPGVIDDQVHFREPGLTHKGDISSESAAAAAGGVTSFMDMPNTNPQTISIEEWQRKNETAAQSSVINYAFYFGATNDNFSELVKVDPGKVCGIKVFLGASTGNMLVDDETALNKIFSIKSLPVACHCEDEKIIKENATAYREEYGDDIDPSFHPLIRSREACYSSAIKATERAKKFGTRLHLLHLSTAEEMSLLDDGVDLSKKQITGEVCVHHLWFDDTSYPLKGNLIKWNPAIKKDSDRQSLIDAVINGKLDIIATDHAPHTLSEKSASYFKAPSGGPLVQHSLIMMLELCHRGILTPEMVVRKMCHNPAILFNIKDRGFIREGYYADLVLVNPDSPWTVSQQNILYKCKWSPLEGVTFRSQVMATIVNGTIVFNDGKLTGERSAEMLLFDR